MTTRQKTLKDPKQGPGIEPQVCRRNAGWGKPEKKEEKADSRPGRRDWCLTSSARIKSKLKGVFLKPQTRKTTQVETPEGAAQKHNTNQHASRKRGESNNPPEEKMIHRKENGDSPVRRSVRKGTPKRKKRPQTQNQPQEKKKNEQLNGTHSRRGRQQNQQGRARIPIPKPGGGPKKAGSKTRTRFSNRVRDPEPPNREGHPFDKGKRGVDYCTKKGKRTRAFCKGKKKKPERKKTPSQLD